MLNLSGIRPARPSDDDDGAEVDNWLLEDNNVERGDTESIFRELGETINSDFHSTLLDLKNAPELDIWPELYHNSLSLYKAMDILHQKEPRHSGVKSASRHAFLEVRGYGLLMCEQELVDEFEPLKETSTLASLICGNKDFRQVYALWRWCQDAEGIDAGSFGDLAEEYSSLGKIHNARSGSLRALSAGQKGYGVDADAPAPEEDQDVLNRHIRAVFSCIRSCKIDEAIQLAHDNGLPALAAPIKLYKFLVDPLLSPNDPMDENHYISKRWLTSARLFHKMVDRQLPSKGTHTRMLWAAVSGRLQPLLSMATRPSDRLWCFANAALINMLLEACTGECLEDVPKSVQTIFSEITAEEKNPYYSIYPYLLCEDWDGLINWLVDYTEGQLAAGSSMDDQFIRFMTTLATIARLKQHQHDEVAATTLFSLYIDRLVEKGSFGVIPFFASFLPRQTAEDRLQDIMEHVHGDVNRGEYLLALESADFDRDYMAITAASETGDLRPLTRIDNLRWLLINGERTLDSCLSQINCLVRYFTVNDDHQTAIEVLTESVRFQVPEKLKAVQEITPSKALAPVYGSNIAEYECHHLYHFEAFPSCEKFSEQAIQIKKLLTDVKSRPSTANINFREMRLQQATAQAVKDMNREAEIARRKSSAQVLKQKTIELIEKLLLHKGWYCHLPDQTQRVEEMTKVRNISCSGVIELYLASCHAIEDHQAVVDAGILLARPEIHIDKALSKEDLRGIMKKIDTFSKTILR